MLYACVIFLYKAPFSFRIAFRSSMLRDTPGVGRPAACQQLALQQNVLTELAFHQNVLEQLADKVYYMERDWGSACLMGEKCSHHTRIDTKMQPLLEELTTAAVRVVGEKSTPLSVDMMNAPEALPESLRMGVYEAYGSCPGFKYDFINTDFQVGYTKSTHTGYAEFMENVVALQEGTMTLEEADANVFAILGFHGQRESATIGGPRTPLSKSRRPDLYRMFVRWSTSLTCVVQAKKKKSDTFRFGAISLPTAQPDTACLGALTDKDLLHDLMSLDAAINMSPTMQAALRTGASAPSITFSFDATRLLWHNEYLKRVSVQKNA